MEVSAGDLFAAVARRDYESLALLYGLHAQNAIVSYLAMTSRWQCHNNNSLCRNHLDVPAGECKQREQPNQRHV